MSDTMRDRIAAEDEKHCQVLMVDSGGWACRCGTRFPSDLDAYRKWRLHKADAILAIPGIAVVELPEPVYGPDGGGQFGWDTAISKVTATPDEEGCWSVWQDDMQMEPHEARDLAAALLAAADYAERDQ